MSDKDRLKDFLSDGLPHRADDIVRAVWGEGEVCGHCGRGETKTLANFTGRISELRNDGVKIECLPKEEKGQKLRYYQMEIPRPKIEMPPARLPEKPKTAQLI